MSYSPADYLTQYAAKQHGFDPGPLDGDAGKLTKAAVAAFDLSPAGKAARSAAAALGKPPVVVPPVTPPVTLPPFDLEGLDARSAKNIQTLAPKAQPIFKALVLAGKRIAKENGAGDYQLISGNRTYAEQNALYAQGRTKPGNIVTNAPGGYSSHNFGMAGDGGFFGNAGEYLDDKNPSLASKLHNLLAAWVKVNLPALDWGGDWKFDDEPHFEIDTPYTMAQKRERVAAGLPLF